MLGVRRICSTSLSLVGRLDSFRSRIPLYLLGKYQPENHGVGSSILSLGIIYFYSYSLNKIRHSSGRTLLARVDDEVLGARRCGDHPTLAACASSPWAAAYWRGRCEVSLIWSEDHVSSRSGGCGLDVSQCGDVWATRTFFQEICLF